MHDELAKLQARLLGSAYKRERERRVKASQDPTSQDSPIYKEEQKEVRYQGIYTNEGNKTKRVSQSTHTRFKEAARRVNAKAK